METETNGTEEISFAKEIGKSLVISTVTSAGAWTGLLLVGFGLNKLQNRKNRKNQKTENEK